MPSFAALSLPPPLAQAVDVLGFTAMTPVQEQALPPLLLGKDVIAQASSGSGKTVAFGLALLSRLDMAVAQLQALVLCPTRELAEQVSGELRRLARFVPNVRVVTLCGGVPVRTQRPSLEQAPHVVVGTPGRILDHLRRETLSLAALRTLVLDEADRMLDMGFLDGITDIVGRTPADRQTMMFSATYPDEIRTLSRTLQRDPVTVTVAATETEAAAGIEQLFYAVEPDDKMDALRALFAEHGHDAALVFCHTRNDARDVAAELARRGYSVLALHGELEQRDRDEVLLRFAHGSCSVLVATDVAARGLDIAGLPLVVSWELPTDPDVHVHRIGRTGRAGAKGLALSLCSRRERDRVAAIEQREGAPVRWGRLAVDPPATPPTPAPMVTLLIDGGRQDKLRPADLLGALTGDVGLPGEAVGKITILPTRSYVSIRRDLAARAAQSLKQGKIKGKTFRVRAL